MNASSASPHALDHVSPSDRSSGDLPRHLYYLFAASLAIGLVIISENIHFRDFGDYSRAIEFMVNAVRVEPHLLWAFREDGIGTVPGLDPSALMFKLMGTVQHWYSDFYHLRVNSLLAKLVLLLYADRLARLMSRHFQRPVLSRTIMFTAVSLSFFYAHNIGMANSFYAEYAFLLFFPLLLLGFLRAPFNHGKLLIVLGALLCGLSKVQYFYIPALVLVCVVALDLRARRRTPWWLVAALCLAQAVCLLPLRKNPYAELNHHQSTFFGSYMMLEPQQLRVLGLDDEQIACVGIDGWGHKALGPGGTQPEHVGNSCYRRHPKSTADVLAPYLRYPGTLFKLMAFALPHHFTVRYVHLYPYFSYIVPSNGKDFKGGRLLVKLSDLREQTVTRMASALVALGLVLPFLRRPGQHRGLGLSCLFLALFILSQIVISLLGEGIRDLSKHLWAAQLALDFLLLALLAQATLWFTHARRARHVPQALP